MEVALELKRVGFKCDTEVNGKIETLKVLLGVTRDELLVNLINTKFKETIAKVAFKEGLVENDPNQSNSEIIIDKAEFCESGTFDKICTQLGITNEGGSKSSIKLEVKNVLSVE